MFRVTAIILLFAFFNLGFVFVTQISANITLDRPSPSPKKVVAQQEAMPAGRQVLGAKTEPTSSITIAAVPQTVTVPVLTYHYIRIVDPEIDRVGYNLSVPRDIFRSQLQYLKDNGYNPISLETLEKAMSGLIDLPSKPVVLTFDDGYQDFYTDAYTTLKEFGVPATVFVVSDFTDDPNGRYLSTSQIKELSRDSLITIGVHSATHSDLKRYGLDLMKEILGSKVKLEEISGKKLDFFAYPYGSFSNQTKELVKNSGFKAAVSTIGGFVHNETTKYELKRNNVDSTWLMFKAALGE